MDAHRAFFHYYELAKSTDDACLRAVFMLGMLCAKAVASGTFVTFAKGSIGSSWPDPRFVDRVAHHFRKTRGH